MIDEKLEGVLLGERQRSLNKLVSGSPHSLQPGELTSLSSASHAQQIFTARVADKLQSFEAVTELLLSENAAVIAKVLRCKWFFQGLNNKHMIEPDFMIANVFSKASFKTRSKVITALATHLKDEKIAEEYYNKIYNLYGKDFAVKFLPVSSIDFVRGVIMEACYEVPVQQLIAVYKRDKGLVLEYLKQYLGHENDAILPVDRKFYRIDYENLWPLIALDFPEEYFKFYDNFQQNMSVNLGYRTSIVVLKKNERCVVENPLKYLNMLNMQAVLDTIKGDNFDAMFLKMMPENKKDFYYDGVSKMLVRMKPNFRVSYLIKMYERAYGAKLVDEMKFVDLQMAGNLLRDERIEWATKKIENIKPNDRYKEDYYLTFVSPDVAIPRYNVLKDSAATVEERLLLINRMIDCCKVNEDTKHLLIVLKAVAKRHRNDDESLRYGFLKHVLDSFQLETLSSEHWDAIDDMLQIMYANKDIIRHYRQHFLLQILEKFLHFRLINGVEIESIIDVMIEYNLNTLNLITHKPEYESKILDVFYEKYRKDLSGYEDLTDDNAEAKICSILISFSAWNNHHKDQLRPITECEWLMDLVRNWIKYYEMKEDRWTRVVENLQSDVGARKMFPELIFKKAYTNEMMMDFLKHNTQILIDNIDIVAKRMVLTAPMHKSIRILQTMRTYVKKPLGDLLQERFITAVEETKQASFPGYNIVALSSLLPVKECEDLLAKYIPDITKVDVKNLDREEYERTEILTKYLFRINPPISFDLVSRFAKDDYLKFVLPSMLSIAYKKNSSDCVAFIDNVLKKPVSVKKHGVRLAYFLYPKDDILKCYRKLWDTDTNSSIRDVVFQRTFRLFRTDAVKSRRDAAWKLIEHFLQSFSEKDKNLIDVISNVYVVRPEYVSEYCTVVWDTFKRLKTQNVDISNGFATFTCCLTHVMDFLSDEFCENVVKEYLYTMEEDNVDSQNLLAFLIYYLINAKSLEAQQKHAENACNVFKKFIAEKWDVKKNDAYFYRHTVVYFVTECVSQSVVFPGQVNPINLLRSLYDMVTSVLSFEASFDLCVLLKMSIAYVEIMSREEFAGYAKAEIGKAKDKYLVDIMEVFGEHVREELKELNAKYGSEITNLYLLVLNDFNGLALKMSDVKDVHVEREAWGLLKGERSNESLVLAVGLLPLNMAEDKVMSAIYQRIFKIVVEEGSPVVKMILSKKFPLDSEELFGSKKCVN